MLRRFHSTVVEASAVAANMPARSVPQDEVSTDM